jgi:hypothetical protein
METVSKYLVAIASQQLAEAIHGECLVFLSPELIGPPLGDQRFVLCTLLSPHGVGVTLLPQAKE